MSQSNPAEEETVLLQSALLTSDDPSGWCVSFWFYMYGDSVNQLSAYFVQRGFQNLLWSQIGSKGPQWRYGQVTFLVNVKC